MDLAQNYDSCLNVSLSHKLFPIFCFVVFLKYECY
jgi:hypothetical protein